MSGKKEDTEKKYQITFSVSKEIYDWVAGTAKKEDRTKSKVASRIAEDAYDKAQGGK